MMLNHQHVPPHETSKRLKSLHIVLVSPSWPPGQVSNGIVTYCAYLHDSLAAAGHSVTVVTHEGMWQDGMLLVEPRVATRLYGLLLSSLNRLGLLGSKPNDIEMAGIKLAKRISWLNYFRSIDVVEMEESFGWAEQVQQRSPSPVVVRLHGPMRLLPPLARPRADLFVYRMKSEDRALENARALTSPSDLILKNMSLSQRLTSVIPNPIAIPERQWSASEANKNQVLFCGRFDYRKGVDIIIDAFSRIHSDFPDASLVIAGPDSGLEAPDGSLTHAKDFIDKLPVSVGRKIKFVGALSREAVDDLRCKSLMTVVAARFETFSYVAAETMALGSPLICTNMGGIAELVDDGRTGLLFEAGDAGALARQIAVALRDPARMARMGAAGRARAAEMLDPARIAARTVDFYRTVIADADR